MFNRTNILLGSFVLALILLDLLIFGGTGTTFVLKKLLDLVEYLAFWR